MYSACVDVLSHLNKKTEIPFIDIVLDVSIFFRSREHDKKERNPPAAICKCGQIQSSGQRCYQKNFTLNFLTLRQRDAIDVSRVDRQGRTMTMKGIRMWRK